MYMPLYHLLRVWDLSVSFEDYRRLLVIDYMSAAV